VKKKRSQRKKSSQQRRKQGKLKGKEQPKAKKAQEKQVELLRLFIDPASRSSGWALFSGQTYLKSGTILIDSKPRIAERLNRLFKRYQELELNVDEVHVEDVPRSRTCHIYVHYSIGVILAALAAKASVFKVDIPVKAWQKHVDWEGNQEALEAFKGRSKSEDELAAIGMGLWYLAKEEG
jgi:hypothetical protein